MEHVAIWYLVAFSYVVMAWFVIRDYKRAFTMYNIKHNGYFYVVRDERGRIVTITKSRWTLSALGGGF